MNLKTKISSLMLVLVLALMLVACGETTANQSTTGSTQQASATTGAANNDTKSSGDTGSDTSDGSSACGFFSQAEAEAVMGVKLKNYKGQDSEVFRTCYYSTFDEGNLNSKDSSMLSLAVFTIEATPQWYAEVKKGYQDLSITKTLTPVEGIGNDAFSYVGTLMGNKTFTLGVLKGKTFFSIKIDNTELDEAAQTAKLKGLAQEIASKLN